MSVSVEWLVRELLKKVLCIVSRRMFRGKIFDLTMGGEKLRCVQKTCRAVLFMDEINSSWRTNHNSSQIIHRNFVSNGIKLSANEILERVANLIRKEIGNAPSEIETSFAQTELNYVGEEYWNARRNCLFSATQKN